MRNKYYDLRDNHASKNSMNDDTPMCERHEANYTQSEGYQIQNSHDSYYDPQSNNDSRKLLTELNNEVKNDLEDFKGCIRSMRNVHSKLFDKDDGKTTRKIDECEKSQNVSSEQTDRTEPPPPPPAQTEQERRLKDLIKMAAYSGNKQRSKAVSVDTLELDSTASSAIKRPRVESNHALMEEIKDINMGFIDNVVNISEEDVDPAATSKGGDGTVCKCSFSDVALSPNLKSQYSLAQMVCVTLLPGILCWILLANLIVIPAYLHFIIDAQSPIQPLRLLIPVNYPNCSPILLDKFVAEVRYTCEGTSISDQHASSHDNASKISSTPPEIDEQPNESDLAEQHKINSRVTPKSMVQVHGYDFYKKHSIGNPVEDERDPSRLVYGSAYHGLYKPDGSFKQHRLWKPVYVIAADRCKWNIARRCLAVNHFWGLTSMDLLAMQHPMDEKRLNSRKMEQMPLQKVQLNNSQDLLFATFMTLIPSFLRLG
ncbi:hypothetical protein Tco_0008456 [Tanacetum coccineum]